MNNFAKWVIDFFCFIKFDEEHQEIYLSQNLLG